MTIVAIDMRTSRGGCGSVGTHGALFVAALVLLNGSLSTAQAVLGGEEGVKGEAGLLGGGGGGGVDQEVMWGVLV